MADYNISREDEKVTKTFSDEKKKLSNMTGAQKCEYIWSYYKIHIIGAVLLICAIIWFVHYRMTYEVYKLYGVVVNSDEIRDDAADVIEDYLQMEKHEAVNIASGLEGNADNPSSYDNPLSVYTGAASVDFIFADELGADYVCELGAVLNIEDSLPDDLQKLWSDRIVEMTVRDFEQEGKYIKGPVAVDISGTKVQEYFGLSGETCYFLVDDLSGNEEYMEKFYQMLYDIETEKLK